MSSSTSSYRSSYIFATALLVSMAALLIVARTILAGHPAADLLKAFSEAALVGALADWFAVTALFRRPLGLPIPHTAIIPHNKDRIGAALGTFVQENFVNEQVIGRWLTQHSPSTELTRYLAVPSQRSAAVKRLAHLAQDLFWSLDDQAAREALSRVLRELCSHNVDLAPVAGKLLKITLDADKNDLLFQEMLGHAERLFSKHSQSISDAVGQELPWYLPRFVRTRLYRSLVESTHRSIQNISQDPHHPARAEFKTYIYHSAEELQRNTQLRTQVGLISAQVVSSPGMQQLIEELWNTARSSLLASNDAGVLPLEQILEGLFSSVIDTLLQDPVLAERLDRLMGKISRRLVRDHGAEVVNLISETIRSWNTETLVSKLEEQVGNDLQYIRINGTIVGGLVGLVLYFI